MTSYALFDDGWLQVIHINSLDACIACALCRYVQLQSLALQQMQLHPVTLCGLQTDAAREARSSAVCYAAAHPSLPATTHPNSMCVLSSFMINGSGDVLRLRRHFTLQQFCCMFSCVSSGCQQQHFARTSTNLAYPFCSSCRCLIAFFLIAALTRALCPRHRPHYKVFSCGSFFCLNCFSFIVYQSECLCRHVPPPFPSVNPSLSLRFAGPSPNTSLARCSCTFSLHQPPVLTSQPHSLFTSHQFSHLNRILSSPATSSHISTAFSLHQPPVLSSQPQVGGGGFAPLYNCDSAADADTVSRSLPVDHLRSMLADSSMSTKPPQLPPISDAANARIVADSSHTCSLKIKRLIVFVREVRRARVGWCCSRVGLCSSCVGRCCSCVVVAFQHNHFVFHFRVFASCS
jgi:hypothetical protein